MIESVPVTEGSESILTAMRRDRRLEQVPVVGLVDRTNHLTGDGSQGLDYDVRLMRSGRQELLAAVKRMIERNSKEREHLLEVA